MSTEHTIKHTQLHKKIPTLLTLGNSLCGFTAILLALQAYEKILTKNSNDHFEIISHNANTTIMPYVFAACAWVIIGAMIFDALDPQLEVSPQEICCRPTNMLVRNCSTAIRAYSMANGS